MDAYLVDVTSGEAHLRVKNPAIGGFTSISRDGSHAVLYRMQNRSDKDLYLVELASGEEICLTPHDGPGTFFGVLAPDARTVYLRSNNDRDLVPFASVRLDKEHMPGQIEVLVSREDAELQSFKVNDQGTKAALIWNVGGCNELAFVDLSTRKLTPGPQLPAEIVGGLSYSRDGRLLGMVASGSAAPSDIWVLERHTGRFHQVTHSPHAGVELSKLVRPELVHFRPQRSRAEWLAVPATSHDETRATGT